MAISKSKKLVVIAASIVLFLLCINFLAVLLVRNKIPKILTQNSDIPYNITYKSLDFSVWSGYITVDSLVVTEKNIKKIDSVSLGLFAQIENIEITNFSVWNTLFSNKISARKIEITSPKMIFYKNDNHAIQDYKKANSAIFNPLEKILKVKEISITNANATVINATNDELLLHVANLDVTILGIKLTQTTLQKNIPFEMDTYSMKYDSLFYVSSDFYQIKTNKFILNKNQLSVNKVQMIPILSKKSFTAKVPQELDRFDVKVKKIDFKDLTWGFYKNRFFADVSAVLFTELDAEIYRNKLPKDDLSKKKLYSELLRNLPIDLRIKTLEINNSKLVYQEEIDFEKGAGTLYFDTFNLKANNLESGFGKTTLPDTAIKISCIFMNSSPLKINWSWNTLNKSERFKISGSILNFENQQIIPFTKPYLNATVSGKIDALYFNFAGNDVANSGTFKMEYEDLKVEIFQKKDRSKVNKLLTAVGNLFVKNDSEEKPKQVKIDTKRDQAKSFYNFLWISIADGLKQVLI